MEITEQYLILTKKTVILKVKLFNERLTMARPIEWTEDLKQAAIATIIDRISEGESVRSILNKDRENLPSNWQFLRWVSENEELSKQYEYAMEVRSHLLFDEIINIADSVEDDLITTEDGREVVNNGVIQRDRLRVDARKWVLSKMNPKKYGEKLTQELTGANGKDLIPKSVRIEFGDSDNE